MTDIESEATSVEVLLEDLNPNTVYSVKFILKTDYGIGPSSDVKYVDSPKIITKCATLPSSAPSNLRSTEISNASAKFVWKKPETIAHNDVDIDGYIYRLKNSDEKDIDLPGAETRLSETELTLNDLLPATNYVLQVKAEFKIGERISIDESDTNGAKVNALWAKIEFATFPIPLGGLEIINVTVTSATLKWEKPEKIASGSELLHYELSHSLFEQEASNDVKKITSCNSASSDDIVTLSKGTIKTLTGLNGGRRYSIKVRVYTTRGISEWSEAKIVETLDLASEETEQFRNSLNLTALEDDLGSCVCFSNLTTCYERGKRHFL